MAADCDAGLGVGAGVGVAGEGLTAATVDAAGACWEVVACINAAKAAAVPD